jgi:hypothetical protein
MVFDSCRKGESEFPEIALELRISNLADSLSRLANPDRPHAIKNEIRRSLQKVSRLAIRPWVNIPKQKFEVGDVLTGNLTLTELLNYVQCM